jgi:hypothetical protein
MKTVIGREAEEAERQRKQAGRSHCKCHDRRLGHVRESSEIFLSPIYIIPVEESKCKQTLGGNPRGREVSGCTQFTNSSAPSFLSEAEPLKRQKRAENKRRRIKVES